MPDFSDDLAAWLFGSVSTAYGSPSTPLPLPSGSAGVLQRLATWFPGDPCGPNQHLTGIAAATGLTAPSDAVSALLSVSGAGVILSLDGTAATAANGLVVPVGALLRLTGIASLRSASLLQVAAGAVVDVAYFT